MRQAGALLLALACVIAAPAGAQLLKSPSPVGEWNFSTPAFRTDCTLSGEMTVKQAGAGAFSCSFDAVWACKSGPLRSVRTEQSCVATQSGTKVVVTSRVGKIVSADPRENMSWLAQAYAPDNFDVTINTHGDEMSGLFKSFDTAPVKFRRKLDLIS